MNTAAEKADLSGTFVPTRMVKRVFQLLDFALDGWSVDNTQVALVLGEPGCGKTRIVKQWAASRLGLPDYPEYFPSIPTIAYTEVTVGATPKSLTADFLYTLRDPAPEKGTLPQRIRRIGDCIRPDKKNPNPQIVHAAILDEFHCVIDSNTDKVNLDTARWVTNVLNQRACPLIIVGEPSIARIFARRGTNSQTRKRMIGVEYLGPYRWGNKDEREEYRVILYHLSREIALPEFVNLGATEFALPIHSFSGGYPGQTVQLIKKAVMFAQAAKRPMLTKKLFEEAVDSLLLESERGTLNPFRISNPTSGDAEE